MSDGVLKKEGYDLMGAAFEVYNELGPGFLEEVYQEAIEVELRSRGLPFEAQKLLPVTYKGKPLNKTYRCDILAFGEIIVEIKAIKQLSNTDMAQLVNYMKATGKRVGYLINFGKDGELEWHRLIR
jgi:GxxExxY protein